jgi:hypothetical protein
MWFCYYHCFDGFNKETALFVSPQSICDRKFFIAALVPGMAKENSKMTKYIHFAQTRTFQTTFQKSYVILYSIHPFWFYLYLQCEQIHKIRNTFQFLKKSVAWQKGPRYLLQWIHILFDHMKTFPRAIFLSLRVYNPWIERMVVFYCVECKQSFFGYNMFTLIGYSLFGKIRHYFFTATLNFYSNCVFSFPSMLRYIGTTSMLY